MDKSENNKTKNKKNLKKKNNNLNLYKKFNKIIAFIIFLSGLILFSFYKKYFIFNFLNEDKKFIFVWKNDLNELQKTNHLPKEWNNLSKIYFFGSINDNKLTKIIKKNIYQIIPINKKNGKFYLTITFNQFEEKQKNYLVLQYEIFEKKSNNKIWELGRTFQLH